MLSVRVVGCRLRDECYVGDDSSSSSPSFGKDTVKPNDLKVASRAHANFSENVPLALILAAFAELNGANRKALTGLLSALLAFRVLHAEFGMFTKGAMGNGRPIGFFGTLGVIGGLAGYSAWLVKGYWGL